MNYVILDFFAEEIIDAHTDVKPAMHSFNVILTMNESNVKIANEVSGVSNVLIITNRLTVNKRNPFVNWSKEKRANLLLCSELTTWMYQ